MQLLDTHISDLRHARHKKVFAGPFNGCIHFHGVGLAHNYVLKVLSIVVEKLGTAGVEGGNDCVKVFEPAGPVGKDGDEHVKWQFAACQEPI